MLIRTCIYWMEIIISIISVPVLIRSMYSNDKYKDQCKRSIWLSLIYMVYLVSSFLFLDQGNFFETDFGLNALMIWFLMFVAVILYILSIIINQRKQKKLTQTSPNKNKFTIVFIVLVILPILFILGPFLRAKYFISKSNVILIFDSRGNGGFGDSEYFAYAIGDNFCSQIDLGTSIGGLRMKRFLPKDTLEINDINDIEDYRVYFIANDDSIEVYKEGKQICKKKNKSHYSNIEFERGFLLTKD